MTIEKENTSCRYYDSSKGLLLMQPNCLAERKLNDIKIKIKFNNMGIPSPDLGEKNPKVLRIAFLAGSNMLGLGISEEYFPQRILQEEFQKALKRPVEVVNIAIEGFASAQHAIIFKDFFKKYDPDIVIAYTSTGYKVYRDALHLESVVVGHNGAFVNLQPLQLKNWLSTQYYTIDLNPFLKRFLRTMIENYRLIKLEHAVEDLNDNKLEQADLLFNPTLLFLKSMKKTFLADKRNDHFYTIVNLEKFENFLPQRLFDLDSVDFIFRIFHPKLMVDNKYFREVMAKSDLKILDSDVVFSHEDYFKDTIYFNKNGMKKFAENLALNFAKTYIRK